MTFDIKDQEIFDDEDDLKRIVKTLRSIDKKMTKILEEIEKI